MRETAKIEKKQSSKQTRLHLIAKFSQGNNFWLQMGPSRKCRAKLKCGQKKKKMVLGTGSLHAEWISRH